MFPEAGDASTAMTTSSSQNSRTNRRTALILALLCAINCINFLDKAAFGLVAIPVMAEFGLSQSQFGLINSAFFALYTLAAAALSWFGNARSPRWLLVILIAIWSVVQLPMAFGGLTVLVTFRLLLGVAEAPSMPLCLNALQQWYRDQQRAVPTMILYASPTLAGIIFIPILSHLIVVFHWRVIFVVLFALGCLTALAWGLFGRTGPLVSDTREDASARAAHVPYKHLLLSGSFAGSVLALFAAQWMIGLSTAWIPAYIERGLGFPRDQVGLVLAGLFILAAIGMLGYGVLSQWLSRRGLGPRMSRVWLTAAIFGLAAAALYGATISADRVLAITLFGLALALVETGFGLGPVLLGQHVPARQRPALFGFLYTGGGLGAIAAPWVFGMLIEGGATIAEGYDHGLLATAAMCVVAALCLALFVNPERDAARWRQQARRVDDA